MSRIAIVNLAGDVVLGPMEGGPVAVAELHRRLISEGSAHGLGSTPVLHQGSHRLRPCDVVGGEGSEEAEVTLTVLWLSFVARLQVTLEHLREGSQRLEAELEALGMEGVSLTNCTQREAEARCALLDAETKVRADLIYHRNSEAYILDYALPIARWQELYQNVALDAHAGMERVRAAYQRLTDSDSSACGISFGSLIAGVRTSLLNWTDADALRMLHVADEDGDGWVSLSEFEHVLSKFPAIVRYVRLAE